MMISVQRLVEDYNKLQKIQKPYDFKKHIVKTYLPYTEKIGLVKRVVQSTSYVDINGKNTYMRNTNSMLFFFFIGLIEKYTNVEIDTFRIDAEYDLLAESGVLTELVNAIPESEITILRGMLDMERDDLEFNTRSLVAFLETKFEAFSLATDSITKVLEKPEVQAKLSEMMK